MKKIIALLLVSIFLGLTGCSTPPDHGPTKTGGGGHQQPYDPGTGRYR